MTTATLDPTLRQLVDLAALISVLIVALGVPAAY